MSKGNKAIASAIAKLDKRFGEKVVMKFSDAAIDIETISSGRGDLDVALGGGYAKGKIIEVFAESGCGKTGLALELAAETQKGGGIVAIIDAEHALNTEYCEQIGVSVDDLYISQPSYGEQAIETIRALVETGEIDLIIVDSVAALIPRAELEGESGEAKIGLQARLMSQAMKLIAGPASDAKCTIMFLNQLRSTISMYGPAKAPTGGKALKFYATQRLEIKSKGQLKEGDSVIGFKQFINIVKNKVSPPFKTIENDIVYGVGVDRFTGMVEQLVFEEILTKKGAFYYYGETRLAQGVKKLRVVFDENPDMVEEFENILKKKRK